MFKFSNKLQSSKALRILNCHAFGKKSKSKQPPQLEKFVCKNINHKGDSSSLFSEFPPPFSYVLEETLKKTKGGADHKFYHGFRVFSLRTGRMFSIEQLAICALLPYNEKTLSCVPRLTFDCGELVAYIFNGY